MKIFLSALDGFGNLITFQCSGTLIDPFHVLTAGHCVYLHDEFNTFAESVTVIPGYESGQSPLGIANATSLQSWSGWINQGDFDYDMAIIDLDRPIGAITGWHGYASRSTCSFYRTTDFTNPGYPAELPFDGESMYSWNGTFDGCDGLQVYFNRLAYGGQSGSGAVRFSDGDSFAHAVLSNGTGTRTWDVAINGEKFTAIDSIYIGADKPDTPDLMPLDVQLGSASIPSGQAVDVSYLVLNYSTEPIDQTVSVDVYLSGNTSISETDRLIQTHEFTYSFDPVSTTRVEVPGGIIIPPSTSPGAYHVGVILSIEDADTDNNDSSGTNTASLRVDEGASLSCNGRDLVDTATILPGPSVQQTTGAVSLDEARACSVDITTEADYLFTLCGPDGSADFDSWLCLFDHDGLLVASNDDKCGLQSELRVELSPGTYQLGVSAIDGDSGDYTLAYQRLDSETAPARFQLDFDALCGERRSGLTQEAYETIVDCRLTTSDNTTGTGVNAWSIGVSCDGGQIFGITTAGTVGAADTDDPPGLRQGGFEFSEVTSGPGNAGAVSTVILDFAASVTLPAESSEILAEIDVRAVYPEGGECHSVRLHYRDGLQGSGTPIINQVTHESDEYSPSSSDCTFDVCGEDSSVEFELSFANSCEEQLDLQPGETVTRWIDCELTTRNNPIEQGAKGWEMGVRARGTDGAIASIVDVTLDGTAGADSAVDPAGYRRSGFVVSELTSGAGNEGAIAAVVLSLTEEVFLPPLGTESVLKVAVETTAPDVNQCSTVQLTYVDGLVGQGQPIINRVSYGDFQVRPVFPSLLSCSFEVCGIAKLENWVSFDCNGDGDVDLSDPVCLLQYLFNGAAEPQCTSALDFNGDGDADISDAVAALAYLFSGGPPHTSGQGCQQFDGCETHVGCE